MRNHDAKDILVTEEHNFLYLYYYAPPALRSRLFLGLPDLDDASVQGYKREARLAHLSDLRATTFSDFFANHHDFYVYSPIDATLNGNCEDCLQQFLAAGYTLRSVDRDTDNLLEHFSK